MSILRKIAKLFSTDLAIDLGTANTIIYVRDEGILVNEPSVVAIRYNDEGQKEILAIGHEAKEMLGKTPDSIIATSPIRDGVIADFDMTQVMLRYFIKKAIKRPTPLKPRIIICIPYGITPVERQAVKETVEHAGAREVFLIDEPMAAAIGAGINVADAG